MTGKKIAIAVHVHMHSYEIHNLCCYMIIILFGVGIVFHLANNDYDRLKVENIIFISMFSLVYNDLKIIIVVSLFA